MPKCKECPSFQGRCDSCFIVDGTENIKEVTFCKDCEAYICNDCRDNWIKRGIAYFEIKFGLAKHVEQTPETLAEKEKLFNTTKEEIVIAEPLEETKKDSIDFQTDETFSETEV
jgi:superfamily II helicase